jgi:signal transduction histidine kinase
MFESAGVSPILSALAAIDERAFTSLEDLWGGIVQSAVACLAADGGFIARYEHGADWMTLLALGPCFTVGETAAQRRIPTLEKLDHRPGFLQWSEESAADPFQRWLAGAIPPAASFLAVPIHHAGHRPFGVVGIIHHTAFPYQAAHVAVLHVLAQRISAELERADRRREREHWEGRLQQGTAEQEALRHEVARLIKLKSDLLFLMNHEFRNALATVYGFSEILRDEACTTEEVHEYAADIHTAACRLELLMQEVLRMDRMPTESLERALDVIDHAAIREQVLERVRSRALPRAFANPPAMS